VTALKHIVKANVLAMGKIFDVRADAIFIQGESSEHFHPDCPHAIPFAEFHNARRYLPLDLNYSRRVDSDMFAYLMDNGMRWGEYEFFMRVNLKRYRIMGNDYYVTNEHLVSANGHISASNEALLCRDHPAVPRPLQAADRAHGDQHQGRAVR
jgi:hypothetical protein